VKFYGAYWCPHCAEQKRLLGNSMSKIEYVECGVPANQSDRTQVCKDNDISSYPTWVFPDKSRVTGEQQPRVLAEKSGCSLE
jgi:glutaredoxin